MSDPVVRLTINGRLHEVALATNVMLLTALRDLGYTDVKNGCEIGECGACAVFLNGEAVNSCMVLAHQADGADQCGFCTPGMVISTKALLDRNPDPSEAEIREALSGNLCRCTGYGQIVAGVRLAAERLRQSASSPASSLAKGSSASEDGREAAPEDRLLASGDGVAGLRPLTGERQGVLKGDDEAEVGDRA